MVSVAGRGHMEKMEHIGGVERLSQFEMNIIAHFIALRSP
jgi:hypothetical protein